VTLSPQEAADALQTIERTGRRSATLRGYGHAAPHLMLWGVLWAIGYGLTDLMPGWAGVIWTVVAAVGLLAGIAAVARSGGARAIWRYAGVVTILIAFCVAAVAIMRPTNGLQIAAFIPLVVAMAYAVGGLWFGTRYLVAGIVLAVLTLGGFFALQTHFLLWMAAVGSAALLLAGFWLRRA
jgi:hypothetical protein